MPIVYLAQLQYQGITDIGLTSPTGVAPFFVKTSFGPDREISQPMQLIKLISPAIDKPSNSNALQFKLSSKLGQAMKQ